jgi:hypothetical protein
VATAYAHRKMKKTTSATGKRKRTAEVAGKNAVPPGSKLPRTASYSQTDLFSYLTRPRPSSATVLPPTPILDAHCGG